MRLNGGISFAALLTLAAPLAAHENEPKQTQGIELPASARPAAETVDAFHAALRRGDTQAAVALLSDDALIFESGGAERGKAEYSAHHLPADAEFSQAVSAAATRRTGASEGPVAWVSTEGRTTGSFKGKPIDLLTTETMILRRMAGDWRIVHIHWSSQPNRD
jgi:ketosteroid isomerase-like protein